MIKTKFFIVIISLFAGLSATAQKNVIDEVIWVVGDEPILRSDVENQRLFFQREGIRFEGDPYCIIPEELALQKLYLSQAKIDSVEADEGQVLRQVDRWANMAVQQIGSQEKLEEYMGGKRLSQIKEERKKVVREESIVDQMRRKIAGEIKLRPSDVTKYFNQLSKDSLPMIPTTVEVEVVMMEPQIPIEDIDNIKERLRLYTEQINSGEISFAYAAARYSDDPGTSGNGGQLGFMSKMQLDPEYATAAFALNDPKRISNIVQTEYGYHIIQLIEKRGDRINTRHILLRPKVSDQEVDKALVRLDSLLSGIHAGHLTFEEATYFSSDKDTRNNNGLMVNQNEESRNMGTPKFEMEVLPLGMGVVIEKLAVGEISKPFRMTNSVNNEVVVIARLKSRVNVHQANMQDDYQAIKTMVEDKKREEVINDWIVSKQKTTYIRVSDSWCNCEFKHPGWKKNND